MVTACNKQPWLRQVINKEFNISALIYKDGPARPNVYNEAL